MQTQQYAISRISQWAQDDKLSTHIDNAQSASVSFNTSEQFRKLRHIPMSKLSLNNIFVKKQHQKNFYKKQLNPQKIISKHNYFYQLRQNFQEDIYSFVKKYKVLDSLSIIEQIQGQSPLQLNISNSQSGGIQPLIRGLSSQQQQKILSQQNKKKFQQINTGSPARSRGESKKISEGGYFFNNWRSYERYYCTKAINTNVMRQDSSDNLSAHLVYAIIDMDYERGLRIIDRISQMNSMQQKIIRNDEIGGIRNVKQIMIQAKGNHINHIKQSLINNINPKSSSTSIEEQKIKKQKQISLYLISLRIIIKGLRTLGGIIKLTDELNNNTQLAQTFFNRDKFNLLQDHYLNDPKAKMNLLNIDIDEINTMDLINEYWDSNNEGLLIGQNDSIKQKKKFDKKPSYNLTPNSPKTQPRKIMKSTQNLITYKNSPKKHKSTQQIKLFIQLASKYQKLSILNNLMFLIGFTKKVKIQSCKNDYYKLLFSYLKNGTDQLEDVIIQNNNQDKYDKQKDYYSSNTNDRIKISSPQSNNDEDDCSNLSQSSILNRHNISYNKQIDYVTLLIELKQIKIFDRINFATRLLSRSKKVKFINLLQSKIIKFPFLDNLLLFTKFYKDQINQSNQDTINSLHYLKQDKHKQDKHKQDKHKQDKHKQDIKKNRKNSSDSSLKYYTHHQLQKDKIILKKSVQNNIDTKDILSSKLKTISQNFVDQYGDLATIAYLSNQYPCLQKFCDYYRESLLLSYEQDEVEKLDAMKQKAFGEQSVDRKSLLPRKCPPFLSQINFRQQKVNQNAHQDCIQMDSRRCEICALKFLPDKKQCYIECSKCKHGGHLQHLIKWYNSYQNCPNVNCACVCN